MNKYNTPLAVMTISMGVRAAICVLRMHDVVDYVAVAFNANKSSPLYRTLNEAGAVSESEDRRRQ